MTLAAPARERLRSYEWPGNVRELRNCLERAMILADGGAIEEKHLRLSPEPPAASPRASGAETLQEIRERAARTAERASIARALERAGGDRTAAAAALGLTPKKLDAKLREHGLDG
jgi:DNA-binding NtrC family response regulator